MVGANFDFQGMDTLIGVLHNLSPRVTQYLTVEMEDVSYDIFNESQKQVPVDTSALKNSGHVDEPLISPGDIEILIGYGGAAARYAFFVHENLSAHHDPPTKAKYLEDPMNDALNNLTRRMMDRLEGVIMNLYPAAPARAVTRNTRSTTTGAYGKRSAKSLSRRISRAPAMTPSQIESAIRSMASGQSGGGSFGFHTGRSIGGEG